MTEIREGTELGHEAAWGYVIAGPNGDDMAVETDHDEVDDPIAFKWQQDAAFAASKYHGGWTVCALIPVALLDRAP